MRTNTSEDKDETSKSNESNESSNESDVDVDFEFMPASSIDYHGLKTLLKQIFATDVEIHEDLVEEIIKDSIVIKSDSLDPIAFVSLLDLKHAILRPVKDMLMRKIHRSKFDVLFEGAVGLLFNDRLINMPAQLVPNLFTQFFDLEYKFDYLVYISKVYLKTDEDSDQESEQQDKSSKRKKSKEKVEYFQEEDEFIQKFAILTFDYEMDAVHASDSKRAFYDHGVHPLRRVFVLEMSTIPTLIKLFKEELV